MQLWKNCLNSREHLIIMQMQEIKTFERNNGTFKQPSSHKYSR